MRQFHRSFYDINNEIFEDLGAEKRELIQPNDVPQLLKMPLFLSKTVVSINTLVWIRFGLSVLPFQMSKWWITRRKYLNPTIN